MDSPSGRKRPVHFPPLDRANRATIIFLTVCTRQRTPRLANEATHEALRSAWTRTDRWTVGRYVVLPDHLHLFCAPSIAAAPSLRSWVSYWKRLVSQSLCCSQSKPLWQRDFWDTQLRRGESYASKWEYVRSNPVRHGLVESADDWPFQGELNILPWDD